MAKMTKKHRDAMGYVRVSTVGGRRGSAFHSPEAQLDVIQAAVDEAGGRFVGYESDLNKSAYTGVYREGWDAVVRWLMEAPAERMIVAYDTSRTGRELISLIHEVENVIVKAGGRLILPEDRIDTDKKGWEDDFEQRAVEAKRYSRKIGRQWRLVHERRVSQGRLPSGHLPYGYAKASDPDDPDDTVLVPDPDTAPVVERMYRLYCSGRGLREIARALNADGVPSPSGKQWVVSTVRSVLRSGHAAARFTWEDEDHEGSWEPIITTAVWETYQAEQRRREKIPPKSSAPKWVLGGGLGVCGLDGSRLVVSSLSSPRGVVQCSGYRSKGTCDGVFMLRSALDAKLTYYLARHLDELGRRTAERLDERNRVAREEAEAARAAAEERLEVISSSRVRVATQGLDLGLTSVEVARAVREYEDEAAEQHRIIDDARAVIEACAPVGDVYDQLERGGEGMSTSEWSRTLAKVLKRVELHPDRIVFVPMVGRSTSWKRQGRRPKAVPVRNPV